jgi:hypothetical protein
MPSIFACRKDDEKNSNCWRAAGTDRVPGYFQDQASVPAHLAGYWQSKGASKMVSPEQLPRWW